MNPDDHLLDAFGHVRVGTRYAYGFTDGTNIVYSHAPTWERTVEDLNGLRPADVDRVGAQLQATPRGREVLRRLELARWRGTTLPEGGRSW